MKINRNRRIATLALLAGTAVLASACGTGTSSHPAAQSGPAVSSQSTPTTAPSDTSTTTPVIDDDQADAEALDDSAGFGDEAMPVDLTPTPDQSQGGNPVDLDNAPQTPAQCDGLTDGELLVAKDIVLVDRKLVGNLDVTNCGDAGIDWTASTKPWVELAHADGNLAAGSTTSIAFDIDANAIEPGAFDFKIKVVEPGNSHYANVHGFRPTFGSDVVADVPLSAGEDAGGCNNQCITKAILKPNMTSPNVGLDVGTNTPAYLSVFVSTSKITVGKNGVPQNVPVAPIAHTNDLRTSWLASLKPLQAGTKYWIVVRAIDSNDHTSYRVGSFMTTTPVQIDDLQGDGPAGCAAQCIDQAKVTPQVGVVGLAVHTVVPASMQVWVSTGNVVWDGEIPTFGGVPAAATTNGTKVQDWPVQLGGLDGDTTYAIIVQATDADGFSSYRVGEFHTLAEPKHDVLITVHELNVTYDGDSSWKNRGEISFRWGVGDEKVGGIGEDKMSDPATRSFARNASQFLVRDVTDLLPNVVVDIAERDLDARIEFCAMGNGIFSQPYYIANCDTHINVASTDALTLDDLATHPTCDAYGIVSIDPETRCVRIETGDPGHGEARFWTVVSFDVLN